MFSFKRNGIISSVKLPVIQQTECIQPPHNQNVRDSQHTSILLQVTQTLLQQNSQLFLSSIECPFHSLCCGERQVVPTVKDTVHSIVLSPGRTYSH